MGSRRRRAAWLLGAVLPAAWLAAGVGRAQEPRPAPTMADLEQRVRELEEIVRQLQAQGQKPVAPPEKPQTPPSPPSPPDSSKEGGAEKKKDDAPKVAGWDNGFFLRSADKAYQLRITGQIQGDSRSYVNTGDRVDIDAFSVRRARLGIEATVFDHYEFRFLPDFGNGQTRVQDAYGNVHYVDWLQFEAGKFKQPFSYEQLVQDRFVPTMERSLIDQLVPARDVGVMVHGQKLFGDRFDYAVSVSNGEINGDADVNDNKDVAARVAVRPFASSDPTLLSGLQFGMAATTGVQQELVSPAVLRTPGGVPWFQFNATVRADGVRNRYSPEVSYFLGGLGLAAQYYHQDQRLHPALVGAGSRVLVDLPAEGFYVLATYLLTGEERTTYSQAVVPNASFDPAHPLSYPGAWELVTRVSHLELGSEVFAPGVPRLADPTRYTRAATELTLGFNWYLNAWVRAQFNYEHAWFDSPVRLGPAPNALFRHSDAILARMQVIF